MVYSAQRATLCLTTFALLALPAASATAQISLSSAVGLAVHSSPKVAAAQAEVDRSRAALSETKDAYVPVIVANGGVGESTGVPLGLPTVFTMSAQSLAFNMSQSQYIKAAKLGWNSAQLALKQAQDDVAEDVVNTYLALDNAQQSRAAAQDALDHAQRLLEIVQDRVAAGTDPHIELPQTDLTVTQIEQQLAHTDTQIATLSDHLARLTGLTGSEPSALHHSIPALPDASALSQGMAPSPSNNPGIRAAFLNADAKQATARGDARYLFRPQISFAASYARITTAFSNYALYYPAFNPANDNFPVSYNALSVGVNITLPLLDQAHRARARQSAAEAKKALADARQQQNQFIEGELKLQRSTSDLEYSARIAKDQEEIAEDQLQAVLVQLQPNAQTPNGQPLTPKDEQNARLAVAQRRLDLLKAQLQLEQAKVTLMRQTGQLSAWIQAGLPATPSANVGVHTAEPEAR